MSPHLDKIFIRDLVAQGIVGTLAHEREHAQKIIINLTLSLKNIAAKDTDCLSDTVDYQNVANTLVEYIAHAQPQLIEKLAFDLMKICFGMDTRICSIQISVEKPSALQTARSAGFSITRQREECI